MIYYLKAPLFLSGSTLSLIGSSCSLVQPLFVGELVQRLPTTTSFSQIRHLFFYILAFIILEFLLSFLGEFISAVAAARSLRDLRNRLFRGVIEIDYPVLAPINKAELQTRILNDTAASLAFPASVTVTIFGALIKGVVGIVVALYISWQLGLVFLAIVPPLVFLSWLIGRLVQPRQARLLELYTFVGARAYDILSHIYLVKLFMKEELEDKRFREATQAYYKVSMSNLIIDTFGA